MIIPYDGSMAWMRARTVSLPAAFLVVAGVICTTAASVSWIQLRSGECWGDGATVLWWFSGIVAAAIAVVSAIVSAARAERSERRGGDADAHELRARRGRVEAAVWIVGWLLCLVIPFFLLIWADGEAWRQGCRSS
jgi:hypothetical protein